MLTNQQFLITPVLTPTLKSSLNHLRARVTQPIFRLVKGAEAGPIQPLDGHHLTNDRPGMAIPGHTDDFLDLKLAFELEPSPRKDHSASVLNPRSPHFVPSNEKAG